MQNHLDFQFIKFFNNGLNEECKTDFINFILRINKVKFSKISILALDIFEKYVNLILIVKIGFEF